MGTKEKIKANKKISRMLFHCKPTKVKPSAKLYSRKRNKQILD